MLAGSPTGIFLGAVAGFAIGLVVLKVVMVVWKQGDPNERR